MKRVLRSLIDVDGTHPPPFFIANYQYFIQSKLQPDRDDDLKIWKFVRSYYQTRFEPPSLAVLYDHFRGVEDLEVEERLREYEKTPLYIRTNFQHLIGTLKEERDKAEFLSLVALSADIVRKGVTLEDKTRLKGLKDAVPYLLRRASNLVTPEHNARIRGNFRDDFDEVFAEYEVAELDRSNSVGKLTGLADIDRVIRGIRKGQLWIHAAYVGELKSTFAINWCYNLVTRYCSNVFYASLEMSYEELRMQIGCLHSTHPKWGGRKPLIYEHIQNGLLSQEEKDFFVEVWKDFTTDSSYGDFHCWCPADDSTTISDIRREAEMVNQESEVSLIVVDHGGLADAEKTKKNKDYTVELNSILRGCKKLARNFNNGAKVPVLVLFQINREGKDYADKNQGRYKLRHLSYANEAERSADIVTTSYLNDDLRSKGFAIFDNLKRRAGPKFEPIQVRAHLECYRLYNLDGYKGSSGTGMVGADYKQTLDLMDSILCTTTTTTPL